MTPAGLLHSEIHGSMPAYGSPWLIAVCCVLLRLPVPRHSPCALCSLTMHCSSLQASAHRDNSCYVFRLIVVSYPLLLIVTLLSNLISQLFLSLFNFQGAIRFVKAFGMLSRLPPLAAGGHKWTRTTDLALIRRAL